MKKIPVITKNMNNKWVSSANGKVWSSFLSFSFLVLLSIASHPSVGRRRRHRHRRRRARQLRSVRKTPKGKKKKKKKRRKKKKVFLSFFLHPDHHSVESEKPADGDHTHSHSHTLMLICKWERERAVVCFHPSIHPRVRPITRKKGSSSQFEGSLRLFSRLGNRTT